MRSYNYPYVYKKTDPEMPKIKRVLLRSQYIAEDTFAFGKDLYNGDTNAIIYKMAGNVKRNVRRAKDVAFVVDK